MMMSIIAVIGVVLLLIIVFAIYVIMKQRQFVHLDELCMNAMSQISVQLNSRWDAVQNLAKMAAQYTHYESETIIETIRQRRMNRVSTAEQANEQQGALSQVMGQLIAVGEAYPELKADTVFKETMEGMRDFEDKVRMSRMVYNDTATKMNRMVRQWPDSMVASLLNFHEREYLQLDEARKNNYPDLDDVFKRR
jgi:LemA protein